MAVNLRTTQEYLNTLAGTVGLTKQQCLQRIYNFVTADVNAVNMTAQEAAIRLDSSVNGSAAVPKTSIQDSLNHVAGTVGLSIQEASRRIV